MIKHAYIVGIVSLLAFVPFAIISYNNQPTGIEVTADPVNYMVPVAAFVPMTLPDVKISTQLYKPRLKSKSPALVTSVEVPVQCETHDLLSGTGKVRICQ